MLNRGNPNWVKGVSANPGGRPKKSQDIVAWLQQHFETPEGRAHILRRIKKSDYVLVRMWAYAYGEPKQILQVEATRSVLELTYPDGRRETRSFEPKAGSVH